MEQSPTFLKEKEGIETVASGWVGAETMGLLCLGEAEASKGSPKK